LSLPASRVARKKDPSEIVLCDVESEFIPRMTSYAPGPARGVADAVEAARSHCSRVDVVKQTFGAFFAIVVGSRSSKGGGA
jgi:hypothetical protein